MNWPLPKDDGSPIFHLPDYAAKFSDYSENIMRKDIQYGFDSTTGLQDYFMQPQLGMSPIWEKYYGYGRAGDWKHEPISTEKNVRFKVCGDVPVKEFREKYENDVKMRVEDWVKNNPERKDIRLLDVTMGDLSARSVQSTNGYLSNNVRYYACDNSASTMGVAVNQLVRHNIPATLSLCDGENLPYADGTMDILMSLGPLNNYTSPRKGMEEFLRVLKPGGIAVISDEHWAADSGPATKAYQWWYEKFAYPQKLFHVPRDQVPKDASDLKITFPNQCFYLMTFKKPLEKN
eukprot:gnl/MRDRNA2_/MRDRNA2_117609_c0_seq1.p1 gnl/MRDRNA2_/MRDRNA2_117609_c0~~gnl/MRDRNA2_/MRDRNA2_117609_c0_seq1.p1  ORF type:complete len:290 (-),score=49.37 gnl/MRDRNA2_/MRDRNA2_117609_c0_seq1:13-882(-)